jgi:hypothetical protein
MARTINEGDFPEVDDENGRTFRQRDLELARAGAAR